MPRFTGKPGCDWNSILPITPPSSTISAVTVGEFFSPDSFTSSRSMTPVTGRDLDEMVPAPRLPKVPGEICCKLWISSPVVIPACLPTMLCEGPFAALARKGNIAAAAALLRASRLLTLASACSLSATGCAARGLARFACELLPAGFPTWPLNCHAAEGFWNIKRRLANLFNRSSTSPTGLTLGRESPDGCILRPCDEQAM
mmetsp:Transcript_142116/g.250638  ORF Transcript_142116/g.250638 Transcript_142116/m.250638 type:complete len:201 (+) Transcript_142116:583-1185(+)